MVNRNKNILNIFSLFILVTILCNHVTSRSIDVLTRDGQWNYLVLYEHAIPLADGAQPSDEQFEKAVKDLQHFFRIPMTGKVDETTLEIMKVPRCGSPDNNLPVGKFVLGEGKWQRDITWSLDTIDSGVDRNTVLAIIRQAFQAWQPHVPMKITESTSGKTGDIKIDFFQPDGTGEHGDGYPFYEHTVAHAFYPGSSYVSGDVHFNLKKTFSYSQNTPSTMYSTLFIAVHELGHALGLDHSSESNAIMYPIVKQGVNFDRLHFDDVVGMEARYDPNFIINRSSKNTECQLHLIWILSFFTIVSSFWNYNKLL